MIRFLLGLNLFVTATVGGTWGLMLAYERWEGINDLLRWQQSVIEKCTVPQLKRAR